jgi:SpoVK/Ycf46/Vps4 family AAA+-type ATPase
MNIVDPKQLLDQYIRARYSVIGISSHEEVRVLDAIKAIAAERRQVVEWSFTAGLVGLPAIEADEYSEPSAALEYISKFDPEGKEKPTLFVMKDLHSIMARDIRVVRFVRDIAAEFKKKTHTLILLSPQLEIPADLEKSIVQIDWPLPNVDELDFVLRQAEKRRPVSIPDNIGENGAREAIVNALRGLTETEAANVISSAIVKTRELGESMIPIIVAEKAQIIRRNPALEYFDDSVTMADVGGLKYLKEYIQVKRSSFTAKARARGVDMPKGVLLLGINGTGKSLAAKAIAGGKMPLLRLDYGALMGGLVGQSEGNLRGALKIASSVGQCVLWLDEAEKALSSSGGESDGGTSSRMFGTLLTFLQESTAPIYFVCTVNEIKGLRPELLRRFDDIFFVDLPDAESRLEVLSVHLRKRGYNLESYSISETANIVAATWAYSGAEIEKVVKFAVERAFYEGASMTYQHLLDAAKRIVPISKTKADEIADLRTRASQIALQANAPLETKPVVANIAQVEIE